MALSLGNAMQAGPGKKKLVIAAGLLGALLVVLVIRFAMPGDDASDSASAGPASPSGLFDTQPGYLETIAHIARLKAEKSYDAGDSRDPLEPLIRERNTRPTEPHRTESTPAAVDDSLPWMSLHGIIWDPENPIAIIDGLDLRVGDSIKGARVVEIGYDRVVLTYKSRRHVLTVE